MKCPMKNNSDYDMEAHQDLIDSLFSHANRELKFHKPPTLVFQTDPRNYGALSKTAQYNPSSQEITIYVDGRHIKDILRSFAHELVHHHQNEQGRLSGANLTQGEKDFDDIEGEAYLVGNREIFRRWEDQLKEGNPTIYNERRIYKMSTKKWKNKELSNLMTEKYGFKMDLNKLNESAQAKPRTLEEQETSIQYPAEITEMGGGVYDVAENPEELKAVLKSLQRMPDFEDFRINDIAIWKLEDQIEALLAAEPAAPPPVDEARQRDDGASHVMQRAGTLIGQHGLQGMSLNQLWQGGMYDFIQDLADELGPMIDRGALEEAKGCGDKEPMEEAKQEDCEECGKTDCECEKDDDPRGRAQTGDSPTKKRTGKNSPDGKRFASQSLKEWKDAELSNNLNEKFGFKMDLKKLLK